MDRYQTKKSIQIHDEKKSRDIYIKIEIYNQIYRKKIYILGHHIFFIIIIHQKKYLHKCLFMSWNKLILDQKESDDVIFMYIRWNSKFSSQILHTYICVCIYIYTQEMVFKYGVLVG